MENKQEFGSPLVVSFLESVEIVQRDLLKLHLKDYNPVQLDCIAAEGADTEATIVGDFKVVEKSFARASAQMPPESGYIKTFKPGLRLTFNGEGHVIPDITYDQFTEALVTAKPLENGLVKLDLVGIQKANQQKPAFQ